MKVICMDRDCGYEIRLCLDDNGEYFIDTELHGEIFITASITAAETRFYNVLMRRF